MFRTVMSTAFLSAFLAAAPTAISAEAVTEKCEKAAQCEKGQCEKGQCEKGQCEKGQCEKGQCAASACTGESSSSFTNSGDNCANKSCAGGSCEGKTCKSTQARLIQFSATLDSGPETVCGCNKACTSCPVDELVGSDDRCNGCSGCPAELTASTSTSAVCQCGDGCNCCADAEQKHLHQIAALHWRLLEEGTKSKVLAAQLEHREELAKAHVEFARQMLKKEVENVHLHMELELANVRNEASQEIAGTAFEFERVKASLELVRKHNDHLKLELAQRNSGHAEALAASQAANAGLAERVADLEKRLESINVRLAGKRTGTQLK